MEYIVKAWSGLDWVRRGRHVAFAWIHSLARAVYRVVPTSAVQSDII